MKKLSKKTLNKSFRNWYYGHLTCFSQEHMQTFGYLCAMLPIIEELYDTKEEQKEALETYKAFFNTEPQLGTVIVGVTVGLEEAKANGEGVTGDTINGLRAGLMGPIAGIGDSLIQATLIPILITLTIAISGESGSPLGPIFYTVALLAIILVFGKVLFNNGYRLGKKSLEFFGNAGISDITKAVGVFGLIVVGCLSASRVKFALKLAFENNGEQVLFSDMLNQIFPNLLSLLILLFYYLLKIKKVKMQTLFYVVMAAVIALSLLGIV